MTTDDIDAVIAGLTKAMRTALIWPKNHPDGNLQINSNYLYPQTINGLIRRGLVDKWSNVTPLGLAVRTRLKEREHQEAPTSAQR